MKTNKLKLFKLFKAKLDNKKQEYDVTGFIFKFSPKDINRFGNITTGRVILIKDGIKPEISDRILDGNNYFGIIKDIKVEEDVIGLKYYRCIAI